MTAMYTRLIHSHTHTHVSPQYSHAGARRVTVNDVDPLSSNRTPNVAADSPRVFVSFAALLNTLTHARTPLIGRAKGRRAGDVDDVTHALANTRMYPAGDFRTVARRSKRALARAEGNGTLG